MGDEGSRELPKGPSIKYIML